MQSVIRSSAQCRGLAVLRSSPAACATPRRAVPRRPRAAPEVQLTSSNGAATPIIDTEDQAKLDALLQAFKAMDVDGNGHIDKEELRMLLESTESGAAVMFTEHWLPDDELDRVMEQYDVDKNGVIDFDEFKQIVYDGLLLDGKLSEYEAAFRAVDSSGNGTIGATELAQLFAALGNPMSYTQLVDVMQKYDKDESGQIEFSEFLLMFRDNLLELQDVWRYMESRPQAGSGSASLLDYPEGDVPIIFSEKEFEELLASSKASGKVFVLFNALTWCRPCKGMERPVQRLAEQYKATTVWAKVFGNANTQTKLLFKDRLKIRSTPCFIVFKNGEAVFTQTGTNKEKLEAGLREAIGDVPDLPETRLYTESTQ